MASSQQTNRTYPDTPEGRTAFGRDLLAIFGSHIEWRPTFRGIEIRKVEEKLDVE